jgi:DNA-binding NtrC family response regulator
MTTLDAVLERPASSIPLHASGSVGRYRLLVADDQSDVITALRLLFAVDDVAVTGAASPAEALALASAHAFDAALVDLNYDAGLTSGEQGLELVSALARRWPTLPLVVMTAWGSTRLAHEATRLGARDFVEKPWDEDRLVRLLRTQLELGRALRRVHQLEADSLRLQDGAGGDSSAIPIDQMRLLDVEGRLVRRAMEHHRGNVSRAARTLGLSRSALYRRLERHKIL